MASASDFWEDDGSQPAAAPAPARKSRAVERPLRQVTVKARKAAGQTAKVLDFDLKGVYLSINQWARETNKDRDTLMKKVALNRVQAVNHQGRDLYKLGDLCEITFVRNDKGEVDNDKLAPFQRRAHYASELDKQKLLTQEGKLLQVQEVEERFAQVFKLVAHSLDTLPDILERDCGLVPAVVKSIEERLDKFRIELHKEINAPAATQKRAYVRRETEDV